MIVFAKAGTPVEWNKPFGESGGPLTWRPVVPHPDRPSFVSALAMITCPWGHELRVSPNVHTIAPDGTMSPSYVCTAKGCTFHVFVRLADWET